MTEDIRRTSVMCGIQQRLLAKRAYHATSLAQYHATLAPPPPPPPPLPTMSGQQQKVMSTSTDETQQQQQHADDDQHVSSHVYDVCTTSQHDALLAYLEHEVLWLYCKHCKQEHSVTLAQLVHNHHPQLWIGGQRMTIT